MVTDKLGSYTAVKQEMMPGVEHHRHKGLNNGIAKLRSNSRSEPRGRSSGRISSCWAPLTLSG
jgi:putative transposase